MNRTLLLAILTASLAAACAPAESADLTGTTSDDLRVGQVHVPLHTEGRWIMGAHEHRVKLASVNWYGAEELDHVVSGLDRERLDQISARIAAMGFNSVRLPWSNEMVERDPIVDSKRLRANPELVGRSALEILDAVIESLQRHGVMVILDNHSSDAEWCCSNSDGNERWENARYPEWRWIRDWRFMARRYRHHPGVVGADLRNEPRGNVTWDEWAGAAERAGDAVLEENPHLLVFVEGVGFATDLGGVFDRPVRLSVDHRLVYSPHEYAWESEAPATDGEHTYLGREALHRQLGERWGYILEQGHRFTAPVWVGEFGTCHAHDRCFASADPHDAGHWFAAFRHYLEDADIDWSYWALNGTRASSGDRHPWQEEGFGVLDAQWNAPAFDSDSQTPRLLDELEALQVRTQGPP